MTYVKEGKKHYHAMNGSIGCIPDNNEVYTRREHAVKYLCDLFDNPRGMYTQLINNGIYYFASPKDAGADYAEVSMPCNDPECTEGE